MARAERVLIFLKAPRTGTVKTRLAAAIGAERACAIYRKMAEKQMDAAERFGGGLEIHYTPREAGDEMREWLGPNRDYFAQADGDLGVRMCRAMDDAFRRGARKVALIGADCPALTADRLEMAFARMRPGAGVEPADVVFGPAVDGGYYLIAVSRPTPILFEAIPWSSPDTLRFSRAAAARAGLVTSELPCEQDVDDYPALLKALQMGSLNK